MTIYEKQDYDTPMFTITMDTYQSKAMTTRLASAGEEYALLGLVGEVGEFFSLIAKAVRDGEQDDYREMAKKELGDILWFIAALAEDHGYTLGEIAEGNLTKLAKRKAAKTLQGSGDNR